MQTEEETSASGTETSSAVQRPNPMTAVTDETAFQSLGVYMALPEEAEDPLCFILNGEVAEIQFSYHEIPIPTVLPTRQRILPGFLNALRIRS